MHVEDHADSMSVVRGLEAEVRALRARVAQREESLRSLNGRLLKLERGEFSVGASNPGSEASLRRELDASTERVAFLEHEIDALRNTKLLRWAAPARAVYARARGPR